MKLSDMQKVLKLPKLSSFSIEQIFTDIGLYDRILIDCSDLKVQQIYYGDAQLDELVVSSDMKRFNEFLTFGQPISLPCASCMKDQAFRMQPYSTPRNQTVKAASVKHHNVFEDQFRYVPGKDELGVIFGDPDIQENYQIFIYRVARNCREALLIMDEIRREGKCQFDPQHHIFVDFVIEDPLIDDELPLIDDPKYTDAVELQQKLNTCVVLKKVGQYPSQADLQLYDARKYQNILRNRYTDYTMGCQLAACGVGAGALVYLRRVFEWLIEEKHKECAKKPGWSDEAYEKMRVNERIEALENEGKKIIPDELSPIKGILYGALSKGVHEVPEGECRKLFPSFRLAIELLLDEEIVSRERAKKIAELNKTITQMK
ncbi:hypothetical protein QYZ88_016215 [Lachnospiraceae bacterium C1.1]|nr:hypothetical protein [Lachnospiraceae bacterium C1.1]